MVVLIFGASHTGKTLLAQKILEKYKFPYLSIDHLKMGLIRSGKGDDALGYIDGIRKCLQMRYDIFIQCSKYIAKF